MRADGCFILAFTWGVAMLVCTIEDVVACYRMRTPAHSWSCVKRGPFSRARTTIVKYASLVRRGVDAVSRPHQARFESKAPTICASIVGRKGGDICVAVARENIRASGPQSIGALRRVSRGVNDPWGAPGVRQRAQEGGRSRHGCLMYRHLTGGTKRRPGWRVAGAQRREVPAVRGVTSAVHGTAAARRRESRVMTLRRSIEDAPPNHLL
jgi:hypothetical protein